MANMSYCKWENTSNDMAQCVASAEDDFEAFDELSEYEQRGLINCLRNAYSLLEGAPPELLQKADINLENL